ncbi:MAG: PilZ domain-containing protein [Treponema sp.]|jgi:hypothetical protein|nr:PilZ domain-containing protein [Treponema sp.]
MDGGNTPALGRKVFFLHPSAFIQNTVIDDLVQQEFEIYLIKDEVKIHRLLKKYPDSIVFACIDEALSPQQWELWVRQVVENKDAKDVGVGIISNSNTDSIRRLYTETYKVSCGFIPIKSDKNKVIKSLIDALNAAGAKGRRKYLRTNTQGDAKTTINLPLKDSYVTGKIHDISTLGLSCIFSQEIDLKKNTFLADLQIKLQSTLLKVEAIVFGSRMEEKQRIYVLLFTPKTDFATRAKIRTFIQKVLQSKIDADS